LPWGFAMAMALLLGILIDCALIHYQFETIRPFLDGKGRMGRLQITFYLCWKGVLHKPLTLHIQ
jgi:Fic family protein